MNIQLSDHFTYRKLLAFVLPPIAMMLLTSVYTMVDGLFISHLVGKRAFAAVNFVFPLIMLLGGLGFMFGTGGTALIAKTLGEGATRRARRYLTQIVILASSVGTLLAVVGMIWLPELCVLLGCTEGMLADAVLYGRVMMGFLPCCILQWSFQALLIAAEKPQLAFRLSVAGGLTNIVLDALFMGVFGWGVMGAAVATGLSQAVAGLFPVFYFLLPNESPLRFARTRMQPRPMLKACANGSSELVSGISGSIVSMLYNYYLLQFYGEDGVAAYGVVMYVSFFFVAIFFGFDMGSAPIFAYHHGANNHDELRNLFRKSLILIGATGLCMAVLALSLSAPLARLFVGYNAHLTALTQHAFCIFSMSFVLMGFNVFASGLFTAMNNGLVSATIAFLRTFGFQVAAVVCLPLLFGASGIWWGAVAAEVGALVFSFYFVLRFRHRYGYLRLK